MTLNYEVKFNRCIRGLLWNQVIKYQIGDFSNKLRVDKKLYTFFYHCWWNIIKLNLLSFFLLLNYTIFCIKKFYDVNFFLRETSIKHHYYFCFYFSSIFYIFDSMSSDYIWKSKNLNALFVSLLMEYYKVKLKVTCVKIFRFLLVCLFVSFSFSKKKNIFCCFVYFRYKDIRVCLKINAKKLFDR